MNEASVSDPNPRQSFLEKKGGILWLGLDEDEEAYPDLIGDALQDYFRIGQLREFVKDLLLSTNLSEATLLNWERRGFQTDRCLVPPQSDSKEDEGKSADPIEAKLPVETANEDDSGKNDSEVESPTIYEDPETGNKNDASTGNKSETASYQPRPGRSGTRPRGDKAINMPNRNQNTGHSSRRSGGTEDDTYVDETDTFPHDRKEIERIGMEHARRYEQEQGHTVEDVSAKNLGYDLRSTTPNGEIRYIEVKTRAKRALVILTSNEWKTAEQLKYSYFLYVVLNAETRPEHYIIQNPTDKVAVEKWYDVKYQVPLSEITEHGKLV